ncbi:hypothetical protein K439DRAFT_1624568 [Ramaria rubella]|nr:hypothetical protein K439DRAFT_1624568 [Ramaria rubella]
MRFLQIRFECNDARDDHHAQQLKGHTISEDNIFFDDDHDLNENSDEDLLYGQLDMTDMQLEDVLDKGYKTLAKEHGMQAAEQIAMTSGWLDDCLDDLPSPEERIPLDGKGKAPPEWCALLDTEKERHQDACLDHIVSQADQVKILDASYLFNDFTAKKAVHKQQVDDTGLKQEFRELEILDEITKLRYEGNLPSDIIGEQRNTIHWRQITIF